MRDQLAYASGKFQPSVCFWDSTAPNPNLLPSVSMRNGLSKLAKANTAASKQGFLSASKAPLASAVRITHLLFLLGWNNLSHSFQFLFAGPHIHSGDMMSPIVDLIPEEFILSGF